MSHQALKTLDVRTRQKWRAWLEAHHASQSEIWLVCHKPHSGLKGIDYEDSVEEALCFGWVDSLIRRLDDDRYARKFTPRKPESRWSTSNRQRYQRLKACGLLAPSGLYRLDRLRETHRNQDAAAARSGKPPVARAEARLEINRLAVIAGLDQVQSTSAELRARLSGFCSVEV